jgi:hypothetical protein
MLATKRNFKKRQRGLFVGAATKKNPRSRFGLVLKEESSLALPFLMSRWR